MNPDPEVRRPRNERMKWRCDVRRLCQDLGLHLGQSLALQMYFRKAVFFSFWQHWGLISGT
jgi:hypothetical protein